MVVELFSKENIMEREEYVAELRRQWALVAEIRLPRSNHHPSEEETKEMGKFVKELERGQQVDQMLLRKDCAYASLDNEADNEPFSELVDDEDSWAEELREETYANLCLRLVFADAMHIAVELLGAFTMIAPDEAEPFADIQKQRSVGKRVACWLARQGYEDRAWAFVEQSLFCNNGASDLAVAISADLSFLDVVKNLLRAREILKREELHWLRHPQFGHALQLNAVHMWVDMWEASKRPEDLASARSVVQKLHPSHFPKGLSIIARVTWDASDLLRAMDAVAQISDQEISANEAARLIEAIVLRVVHTEGSPAFEAVIHQVAAGLQNERWRSLLLEKVNEALEPFRTN